MDLSHSFTVPASVDEAWDAFNQIESMAECFPGATITSVDGDSFKGTCKVKLGPISLLYTGTGTFLERDQSAGRFVVEAKGKDKRGNGTAGATVTAQVSDEGDGSTTVDVQTDLQITGKPAQFGRGVIQDVSDKLLQQFVTCLQSKVGSAPAETTPTPAAAVDARPEAATGSADGPASGQLPEPTATSSPVPAASRPATVTAPPQEDDALDLGATVIPILIKSYGKRVAAAAGALLVLLVIRRLLTRH